MEFILSWKKFDPPHPRGNIDHVICDVIERRACETFKNYRSTFDDVILRNVGGLIGDVIPLHVTDPRYIIIEDIIKI